jgi:hypothetical protein
MNRPLSLLALAATALTACGEDAKPTADATADTAKDTADAAVDAPLEVSATTDTTAPDTAAVDLGPADCDPLQPFACALPWPSNLYLEPDTSRKTGFRLQFRANTLPKSTGGKAPDPKDYATLDGYSVGTPILVHFPDLDASLLPSETNPAPSLAGDAPIALFEVTKPEAGKTDLKRVPYFAELDLQEPDPAKRVLIVHPLVILEPATGYVVAIRGLHDTAGKAYAASPAFQLLRDGGADKVPQLAGRVERFEKLFVKLGAYGYARKDLLLAWDFVTNSDDAMHAPLLKMRKDAFAAVGQKGPELTVKEVKSYTEAENADIAWEVTGTFHVPHFLDPYQFADDPDGAVKAFRFHLGPDGLPAQNGWRDATFWVRIPRSAKTGAPHGLVQYGHGLNGSGTQVRGGFNGKIANTHKLIFYAADMIGMSEGDVPAIFKFILDMGQFPVLPERVHQGIIEWLLLQRAMKERFFTELPEIKALGVQVNPQESFYSGISQGGIYGATVTALSQDVARAHLGVPGNNYSLLLTRSVDFEDFFLIVKGQFPAPVDQAVLLATIQLLWDRVDPVTHYRHLSKEPYPDTPKHDVLLASATGDLQVALLTNEIAVRSNFGVALMKDYGKPVFGVEEQVYPRKGSALVNYSFGNPWAKPGNVPPAPTWDKACTKNEDCPQGSAPALGTAMECKEQTKGKPATKTCWLGDPHGKPRKMDHHNDQMVHFLRTGEVKDVCGGDGCTPL